MSVFSSGVDAPLDGELWHSYRVSKTKKMTARKVSAVKITTMHLCQRQLRLDPHDEAANQGADGVAVRDCVTGTVVKQEEGEKAEEGDEHVYSHFTISFMLEVRILVTVQPQHHSSQSQN
jgi:hypothetical protein